MRIGRKHRPFYRIVVVDARRKRNTGKYVALIGTYDPKAEKDGVKIDMKAYEEWLRKGAQPSEAVLKLVLPPEEKKKIWPDKPPLKKEKNDGGEGEQNQKENNNGEQNTQ